MHIPLDAMRIIHWASGAPMSSELPISDPEPDPGLLGPDSISWRLHEEQWLITAGAPPVFFHIPPPQIASGAAFLTWVARGPLGSVAPAHHGLAFLSFCTTHQAR